MGAGLLVKAVYQPIYPVTDTALSRASPLPHLFVVAWETGYFDKKRIPSSSPRNVNGNIWSSIKSRTIPVDAV